MVVERRRQPAQDLELEPPWEAARAGEAPLGEADFLESRLVVDAMETVMPQACTLVSPRTARFLTG